MRGKCCPVCRHAHHHNDSRTFACLDRGVSIVSGIGVLGDQLEGHRLPLATLTASRHVAFCHSTAANQLLSVSAASEQLELLGKVCRMRKD
jgi:hypothetical protein